MRNATQIFFNLAATSLREAYVELEMVEVPGRQLLFHLEQVVEKSLKGFLLYNGRRPGVTDNIRELQSLVARVDPNLSAILSPTEDFQNHVEGLNRRESAIMIEPRALSEMYTLAKQIYDETASRVSFEDFFG